MSDKDVVKVEAVKDAVTDSEYAQMLARAVGLRCDHCDEVVWWDAQNECWLGEFACSATGGHYHDDDESVSEETFHEFSWAQEMNRRQARHSTYGWGQSPIQGVWYSPRITEYVAQVSDVPLTAIHMTFTESAELLWMEGQK